MTSTHVIQAASRRKMKPRQPAARSASQILNDAGDLTAGGILVHRRTRRCAAFCNVVAALAGIGQAEAH